MKKMISFILAAALTAVAAMPAFAADTTANDDGTWTTSGSDASYANKMMTMVAYEGDGEITVDSIQYIDQTVANESGAFAFENYIPKDLPTASDYTVLVGGETLDQPIDGGKIAKIETPEVAVSGKATAIGNAAITVSIGDAVTADVVDGAFTADVAPGTYDVVYTAPGYLKHTITGVSVEGALALKDIKLLAGDVNASDDVTVEDIGFVVGAYGVPENYDITKDFNADNDVTVEDVGFAVGNYKATATVEAYAAN